LTALVTLNRNVVMLLVGCSVYFSVVIRNSFLGTDVTLEK